MKYEVFNMKQKTKYVLKSLGLIFLLFFFSSIPLTILSIWGIDLTKASDNVKILYSFICDILFLMLIIFIYRKTLIKDGKKFFKDFFNNIEISFKYWIIGVIVMALSNIIITLITNGGIAGNEQQVRKLINMAPLFMIFDVSIYAPFTEELIFRKSFRDVFKNKWIYVIASGFVFGALHVVSSISSPLDLLYLVPYCSLGFAFAYTYQKTDNIFSTIMMHMIHNSLTIAIYLISGGV